MEKQNRYWIDRDRKVQEKLTNKSIKDTNQQLKKYYLKISSKILGQFLETFNSVFLDISEGEKVVPAHLYQLDKYWQMRNQVKKELNRLGHFEISVLEKQFLNQYKDIYESISLKGDSTFNTIAKAEKVLKGIWCADGKHWSDRVWYNLKKLHQTLDDELVHCVVTGAKPTELKHKLQERFGVSYSESDRIVRTELAHIQVQAAADRYKDAGLLYYEFYADTDARTCKGHDSCAELDGKRFLYSEMRIGVNAPPLHPNCRCCILPVID